MVWRVARDSKLWVRRVPALVALLGLWGAAAIAPACSSDERLPSLGGGNGLGSGGGLTPSLDRCSDGETRDCHLTLSEHDGVLACYHGTQSCADGRWSECGGGSIEYTQGFGSAIGATSGLLALGDAGACIANGVENKCDPNCYTYPNERPMPGYTTELVGPVFTFTGGGIGSFTPELLNKAISQPCRSAFDCQADHRCVNPSSGTCAHDKCVAGTALTNDCDPGVSALKPGCVAQICAVDSGCCATSTSCSHSPCQAGTFLSSTCSTCVRDVCNISGLGYCCGSGGSPRWDQACVNAMQSVTSCNTIVAECPCPPGTKQSLDGTSCYRFNAALQTWQQAHDACHSFGMDMVTITSSVENDDVVSNIGHTTEPYIWTGLTDIDNERGSSREGWTWHSGEPYAYHNFATEQPNNNNGADCVGIVRLSSSVPPPENAGQWNDRRCDERYTSICEMPTRKRWTSECVDMVKTVCGADCNEPAYPTGQCAPWLPGQHDDEDCGDSYDLTLGVPCTDGVQVCNRGGVASPANVPIWFFPAPDSNQFPKVSPSMSAPGAANVCSAPAIQSGQCATVMGCGSGLGELMVNPGGSGECITKNNWTLRPETTTACASPEVCEQGTLTGGAGASCTYSIANQGNFDRYAGSVTLDAGGEPMPLARQAGPGSCGSMELGWYYDNEIAPSSISLCPYACSQLQAMLENRVDISFQCPVLSESAVFTQVYEGVCPAGSAPQWTIMIYDTTIPQEPGSTPEASVIFEARSAPDQDGLAGLMESDFKLLRTATVAEPDCGIGAGAVAGCPIDLYDMFEGIPGARNAWVELRITVTPTEDGRNGPTVNSWRLDYSCVASQ